MMHIFRLLGRKVPLAHGAYFERGLEILEGMVKPAPGVRQTYFERGVQVSLLMSL